MPPLFLWTKLRRNCDGSELSICAHKQDNWSMEQMIKTLHEIGICRESIDEIQHAGNEEQAKECALLLIAMYDDRHEYVS